jgi:hypothetical protein
MHKSASSQIGVAPGAATHQLNPSLKPEWLRIPDAIRLFGLCRSTLYELITAGKVKSTALRKRNATRGIRLISYDSLAAYIEEAAQESSAIGTRSARKERR